VQKVGQKNVHLHTSWPPNAISRQQ